MWFMITSVFRHLLEIKEFELQTLQVSCVTCVLLEYDGTTWSPHAAKRELFISGL